MKRGKAKETGDGGWEDDVMNPHVTSASLIVPKEITKELFYPDGRISDKRLETIQYKQFCQFQLAKLPARNPGSKVCDRITVNYSYPTKNHKVTLRMFNELVQHCASSMRIASLVKVNSIRKPAPRAKSAAEAANARAKPSLTDFLGNVQGHEAKATSGDQTKHRVSEATELPKRAASLRQCEGGGSTSEQN